MCWAESGGGVPTCHTGPLPLTTLVIQSTDTFVSDIVIVILSTRWTAASHQSCGRVWTEDLHLVLTLVTLMHAARRCITPVTWTRPPVTFTVPSIRNRWRLRAVLSISRPSPAGGVRGGVTPLSDPPPRLGPSPAQNTRIEAWQECNKQFH